MRRGGIIGAVLLTLAAATAAFGAGKTGFGLRLTAISNEGTAIASPSSGQAEALVRSGIANAQLRLMSTRNGSWFYRLDDTARGTCFAIGLSATTIDFMTCYAQGRSLTGPVIDASVSSMNIKTRTTSLLRVAGFAADSVKRVDAVDDSGRLVAEAPVSDNVYSIARGGLAASTRQATSIIARDASGNVVFTK